MLKKWETDDNKRIIKLLESTEYINPFIEANNMENFNVGINNSFYDTHINGAIAMRQELETILAKLGEKYKDKRFSYICKPREPYNYIYCLL